MSCNLKNALGFPGTGAIEERAFLECAIQLA